MGEKCLPDELRSLFLQDNAIKNMVGMSHMKHLWSLNLSNNFIKKIEALPENLNT